MRLHMWCVVLLSSAAGCSDDNTSCETRVEKRLEVGPTDPPLKFHLERCRLDVGACPELCQMALQRIGLSHPVNRCDVGFVGEEALLDVEYTVFDFESPNCAFVGEDVVFKGGGQ